MEPDILISTSCHHSHFMSYINELGIVFGGTTCIEEFLFRRGELNFGMVLMVCRKIPA